MSEEIQRWADEAMFKAAPMASRKPEVHLLSATPDPLGSIAAMCRMYEGKPTYNLADITDGERKHYWAQVQKTHLKAPLEAVDLHFFIEGVDRAFTHQMVRQRTAVYAQESLRFAVKENLAQEVPLPPSLMDDRGDVELAASVWDATIKAVEDGYGALIDMGIPAEDARGLLPHAVTTRLHYKTNLRNLLEHAGNRLCTQAQFVWRYVFANMVHAIRFYIPADERVRWAIETGEHPDNYPVEDWRWQLIADSSTFKPVCYQLGHCPFTAEFDRKCSIRERVQDGHFDWIDDSEWLLDQDAAR